jgi:conjugal transfer mating pair stabilization protein TraG
VNGRALARELGIGVKSRSVSIGQLDPRLDPALREAVSVARSQGLPNPVITSGNDGRHKDGSRHYINEALDLRGNNITIAQGELWAQTVQARLGPGYFVDYETFADHPERNHLHIQPTGPR